MYIKLHCCYTKLLPIPLTVYYIGSTHDVTVTEDFDDAFQELAIDRHGRPASIGDDNPETFKYDDIKRHTLVEEADEPLIQF